MMSKEEITIALSSNSLHNHADIDGEVLVGELIGHGRYSSVYSAWSDTHGQMALKRYLSEDAITSPEFRAEIQASETLPQSCRWPRYYGVGLYRGFPAVMQERLYPVPFLETVASVNINLHVGDYLEFTAMVLETLAALHRLGWAHGDPHTGNFLLCYEHESDKALAKLIDFNRAINKDIEREAVQDVNLFLREILFIGEEDGEDWKRAREIVQRELAPNGTYDKDCALKAAERIREANFDFPRIGLDKFAARCHRDDWFGEHSEGMPSQPIRND